MICRVASSLQIDQALDTESAQALATEVEVRLRLLIQDAKKFADHAHRSSIIPEDINQAVQLHGDNKLLGFASDGQMKFAAKFHRASAGSAKDRKRKAAHHSGPDLFFYRDEILDLSSIADTVSQTKRPRAPELHCHFLAIRGSQPAIPENPEQHPDVGIVPFVVPVTVSSTTDSRKNTRIENVVEHELSSEQISYYKTVVKDILTASRSSLRAVYASLSSDFGLQNLLPYFIRFMFDQQLHILKVDPRPLWSLQRLQSLLCMVQCMLSNPSIELEAYLHKLNPFILTVMVNRLLSSSLTDDHWALRDYAAKLTAKICSLYDEKYPEMRTKIIKTLYGFVRDPMAPFTSQYGAIVGLAALGERVTEQALFPIAPVYLRKVFRIVRRYGEKRASAGADNPMQAVEAQRCAFQLRVALRKLLRQQLRDDDATVALIAAAQIAPSTQPTSSLLLRLVTADKGLPFVTAGNILTESDCRKLGGFFTTRVSPPATTLSFQQHSQRQLARRRRNLTRVNDDAGKSAPDASKAAIEKTPSPAASVLAVVSHGTPSSPSAVEKTLAEYFQTLVCAQLGQLYRIVNSFRSIRSSDGSRQVHRKRWQRVERHAENLVSEFLDCARDQLLTYLDNEASASLAMLRTLCLNECDAHATQEDDGHSTVVAAWRAAGATPSDVEILALRKILATSATVLARLRTQPADVLRPLCTWQTAKTSEEAIHGIGNLIRERAIRMACARTTHLPLVRRGYPFISLYTEPVVQTTPRRVL